MHASLRIISELPLRELWDDRGPVAARRSRDLSATDVRDLLRRGPVSFVIADVGTKPVWIPPAECFAFWKGEVLPHLAEPAQGVMLEEMPGEYCYFASEWEAEGSPVVVLQVCH